MNYQHYYRTNDPRIPSVHVLVTSDQHVQDLKKHHFCIKQGNLVNADTVYMSTSPRPERWKGRVFRPSDESGEAGELVGEALVFCFETESEMHTFCEKSGAIEGTLYQQIPA
jgi:hypothetical protein